MPNSRAVVLLLAIVVLGGIAALILITRTPSATRTVSSTQPASTQPLSPATSPGTSSITRTPRTYMDVVLAAHPNFPTTQPLSIPLDLNQSAQLVLHDPVYLDAIGHLWVTRQDADPTPAVLKRAATEQVHITRERILFVHRWPDDNGIWQPHLVCATPAETIELDSAAGRQNLGALPGYDWARAFSWNEAFVVPTIGGISIFRPNRRPVELHHNFLPDNQKLTGRSQTEALLDWQGVLAWMPWENGKTGSRGAARFIDDRWIELNEASGWPEKLLHLVPLLDGGVLQLCLEDDATAKLSLGLLDPPKVDDEKIRAIVRQLSDPNPDARQAAFEELTRYGQGIWPILEAVAADQPPDARVRIEQLLLAKSEPALGGMPLLPGPVRVVTRSASGATLLWAEAGVEVPRPDDEPEVVAPAWLALVPGRAITLAPHDMTADLDPAKSRIDIIRGEFIVSDEIQGPRWWLANHFSEPLVRQKYIEFRHVVGQDARGRWLFRKTPEDDSPTLIIDPTLPDPTPRLPVWRFPVANGTVGWTSEGWPATRSGGAWVLEASEWRPLDEKKEKMFTELDEMPASLPSTEPATQPSEPPIFTDSDGTRYYDGRQTLRLIRPDGSTVTWPLPALATGAGDVWLLRAGEDRLFLFNEPGRVLRIKPTPEATEPFELEATFTRRIPSEEHYQRVWLDPAGRIIIAHGDTLSILFPTGRIPPDIAKKIPAAELRETDEE